MTVCKQATSATGAHHAVAIAHTPLATLLLPPSQRGAGGHGAADKKEEAAENDID